MKSFYGSFHLPWPMLTSEAKRRLQLKQLRQAARAWIDSSAVTATYETQCTALQFSSVKQLHSSAGQCSALGSARLCHSAAVHCTPQKTGVKYRPMRILAELKSSKGCGFQTGHSAPKLPYRGRLCGSYGGISYGGKLLNEHNLQALSLPIVEAELLPRAQQTFSIE